MTASPKKPPALTAKKRPAQQRSAETYERILEVAALTLEDVGIERLSTNLICERAGLTPPALYQYFPNKYAVLSELGQRLMHQQNERVRQWITPQALGGDARQLAQALKGLILDTHDVTRRFKGGVWVMRAMRAVPALQQVRLDSHRAVTQQQIDFLLEALPDVSPAHVFLVSRTVVELIYAAVEMLFDEELAPEAVAELVAGMVASHMGHLPKG
ncbi:MAG TPA: TetR/AcrR family transcriptional regulator [Burkholderiaceae bacterium]|nr:TetR/AcrR family transcriptional regulator [Burkholderiaceae bacterium]